MSVAKKKKIGLALGGGGAKGLAHIGVLHALQDAGIEVSHIAGTSMGAVVGGWYAATGDLDFLEQTFSELKEKDMFSMGKLLRKHDGELFKDRSIIKTLEEKIKDKKVENCKIPFAAVATDVKNGDEVVFKKGSLVDVLRASTALPPIFSPVSVGKRLLMDGGFSNPVPADVVRDMGAEFVIAVDVSSKWVDITKTSVDFRHTASLIYNVLSAIEYQLAQKVLKQADIILKPLVLNFKWTDFAEAEFIVRAGFKEAKKNLKDIREKTGYPQAYRTPFQKFIDFLLYDD